MNPRAMGMNASPIDMILGIGLQKTPQGQPGSQDFGALLGLMPQFQGSLGVPLESMDGPLSGSDPHLAFMSLAGSGAEALVPEQLAALFGLGADSPPEINSASLPAGTQALAPFGAELQVVGNDAGNQQLFVTLTPKSEDAGLPVMPGTAENDEKAMLLPVQLRTVERDGNRVTADALMRTATGEDVSVRLKLDVAGISHATHSTDVAAQSEKWFEAVLPQNQNRLTEFLGSLNVKSLVIENYSGESQPALQTALPQATVKVNPGIVMGNNSNEVTQAQNQAFAVDKADAESSDKQVVAIGKAENNEARFGKGGAFGPAAGLDTGASQGARMVEGATVTTIEVAADTGAITSERTTVETPQVRFYNLDNEIDQIKRNPGQKIQIQLVPAQLGKMDLSIVSHRGVITVNLTVDSMQAKQAVEGNLGRLEQQLTASGIKVDSFQLHVNDHHRGNQFTGSQYFQQGNHGGQFQGSQHHRKQLPKQLKQGFALAEGGFAKVMVNCLA